MVRILNDQLYTGDKHYIEAVGLSTDSKPTADVLTGSTFVEINTGDVYMFDEDSTSWLKFPPDAEQNSD